MREMLSEKQLLDEVQRMSYKPGVRFMLHHVDDLQGLYLMIEMWVTDSYNPDGDKIPLYINSMLPPMPTVEYFHRWMLWRFKQLEVHEAMEWFKIDGQVFDDPHKPIQLNQQLPASMLKSDISIESTE